MDGGGGEGWVVRGVWWEVWYGRGVDVVYYGLGVVEYDMGIAGTSCTNRCVLSGLARALLDRLVLTVVCCPVSLGRCWIALY